MHVRDLMTFEVLSCGPNDTLNDAARLLWENDCGFLPVVDHNGLVGGVITDRDICMGAYTQGAGLADLRVSVSMSKTLVTCRPDDKVELAAEQMALHHVRRLPVVDEHGGLCGVLSLNDIATRAASNADMQRVTLKVLKAACQSRGSGDLVATPVTPAAKDKQAKAAAQA